MELIQKYQPVCVVDMHEGVNFYGVNGSIGNSIVVGQTQSGFINALDEYFTRLCEEWIYWRW